MFFTIKYINADDNNLPRWVDLENGNLERVGIEIKLIIVEIKVFHTHIYLSPIP